MNYRDLYPEPVRPITDADRRNAMRRHSSNAATPLARAAFAELALILNNDERTHLMAELSADTAAGFRSALRRWSGRMGTALRNLITNAIAAEERRR